MRHIDSIQAGIDWLSCTLDATIEDAADWHLIGLKLLGDIAREGHTTAYVKLLGYEGVKCGGSFVGSNGLTVYAQFSGVAAQSAWFALVRPDLHISRIDCQVTVKFRQHERSLAQDAYQVITSRTADRREGSVRKFFLITGSDGGDTLYIGAPSSDQRARLYNKEVQSEDPAYEKCWRYEVVFRNERALICSDRLRVSQARLPDEVSGIVASWFLHRGMEAPWWTSEDVPIEPLLRTIPTDVERKLRWLEHQVKPTVRYLWNAGYSATILSILNLPVRLEEGQ